ncbi:hypothetical protein VTJ04DRAFT_4381 [Mycothermus thermophilus]|uniref:uncharacterized protein n=1 Tax=Humicola insolens TaxID=85995 RepID=UPI0037439C31
MLNLVPDVGGEQSISTDTRDLSQNYYVPISVKPVYIFGDDTPAYVQTYQPSMCVSFPDTTPPHHALKHCLTQVEKKMSQKQKTYHLMTSLTLVTQNPIFPIFLRSINVNVVLLLCLWFEAFPPNIPSIPTGEREEERGIKSQKNIRQPPMP